MIRRRKKRPNFQTLTTVKVQRGKNGFGFTLAGECPCYLDCVVRSSPADAAGLRTGHFIMTVNGENVSTWRTGQVQALILKSPELLSLNIARDEDDSYSDEGGVRHKPRRAQKFFHREKVRMGDILDSSTFSSFVSDCSQSNGVGPSDSELRPYDNWCVVVGYLGSHDIPLHTASSCAIQNCVARLQSDCKVRTMILLEVSSECVRLVNSSHSTVASYPSGSVIGATISETDSRFFGILVKNEVGSHISCLVLMVDPQISYHSIHIKAASKFGIDCTRLNSQCSEFPTDSTSIVAQFGTTPFPDQLASFRCASPHNNQIIFTNPPPPQSGIACTCFTNSPLCAKQAKSLQPSSSKSHELTACLNHNSHLQSARTTPSPSSLDTVPSSGLEEKCCAIDSPRLSARRIVSTTHLTKENQALSQVASWATNFDVLLTNPEGQKTFRNFLKSEFAEENIIFWEACNRFKGLPNDSERSNLGIAIFKTHIAKSASQPVNLDNQVIYSLQSLFSNLKPYSPLPSDTFQEAQLQIYNLMKFDPYVRFLKSELYKNSIKAELGIPTELCESNECTESEARFKIPQPFPSSQHKSDCVRQKSVSSLGSEGDCKRTQRSFFPWKRNKRRINSSKDTLSSDTDTSSIGSTGLSQNCKIWLPDGKMVTLAAAQLSENTVAQLISRLCVSHNLPENFIELVSGESKKIVNSEDSALLLLGQELYVERRVWFKLQLPSSQSVGVRAKPNLPIKDVIQPVLVKYCLTLDNLVIRLRDSHAPLDLTLAVALLDRKKVVAQTIEQYSNVLAAYGVQADLTYPSPEREKLLTTLNGTSSSTTGNELFDLLVRLQTDRIEDQRGLLSVSKLEPPTFLQDPLKTDMSLNPSLCYRGQSFLPPVPMQPTPSAGLKHHSTARNLHHVTQIASADLLDVTSIHGSPPSPNDLPSDKLNDLSSKERLIEPNHLSGSVLLHTGSPPSPSDQDNGGEGYRADFSYSSSCCNDTDISRFDTYLLGHRHGGSRAPRDCGYDDDDLISTDYNFLDRPQPL